MLSHGQRHPAARRSLLAIIAAAGAIVAPSIAGQSAPPDAIELLRQLLGDSQSQRQQPTDDETPGSLEEAIEQQTNAPAPETPRNRIDPSDLERLKDAVLVDDFERVELHVFEEDLATVLKLLSIESRRNIIVSDGISRKITADLYGVGFYEALDAILRSNGLDYTERGNFLYVFPADNRDALGHEAGEIIASIIELQYLNASDAAAFASPLLSDDGSVETPSPSAEFLIPDETPVGKDDYAAESVIVIYDYPDRIAAIEKLIARLDSKPQQVLIEATILQVSLNEDNAFGIDFSVLAKLDFGNFNSTLGGVDSLLNSGVPNGSGQVATSTVGGTSGAGGLKVGVIDGDVAFFLRALDEVTDVSMISKPKLLTLNRQPARVLVGTRVGFLNSTTTTDTATVQEVDFLNTGTQLRVRPFIMRDGHIRLELKPQVSSATLRTTSTPQGATVTIPDEDTTELVTNLLVRDGQTVVLGGLFTESTTLRRRQVPVLGDIPLLGAAFRGKEDEIRRSEILFLIRPVIMSDEQLTRAGERGQLEVERVRLGSRRGLLPFSREKRVSQLLIDAEKLARQGDPRDALWRVERALELSPMSPDAIAVRNRLLNQIDRVPERSILSNILSELRRSGSELP